MAKVILLGTGSAYSGPERENTYMLVRGKTTNLLIDCAGSPTQRLLQVGVNPSEVEHVILTHDHPDHIYGFPLFMLNAWMAGRRSPMHVYGLKETIHSAKALLRAVRSYLWPNFFQVKYHPVGQASKGADRSVESCQVCEVLPPVGEFDVLAAATTHFVPTLALRVAERATGRAMAYSADTEPNPNIVEVARGARYLFHEATQLDSSSAGHSSAVEAGKHATQAQVQELVLLHLPPDVNATKWRAAARQTFAGRIGVAKDFDTFEF